MAWQILRGQPSVDFYFYAVIEVGASYKHQGQDIKCGPLKPEMGSIWEIIQETEDSTAVQRKGSKSSHLYDHQNPQELTYTPVIIISQDSKKNIVKYSISYVQL